MPPPLTVKVIFPYTPLEVMVTTPPARTRNVSDPTRLPLAVTTHVPAVSISPPVFVIRYVAFPRCVHDAARLIFGGKIARVKVAVGVGVHVLVGVWVGGRISTSCALTHAAKL